MENEKTEAEEKRWENRARAYLSVLDLIANWNLDVPPGHAEYISRKGIVNMAKAVLARVNVDSK